MSAQYYILAWKDADSECFDETATDEKGAEELAISLVKNEGYATAVICKALKQVNRAHEVVTL